MRNWRTFWHIAQASCLFSAGFVVHAQDSRHAQDISTTRRVAVMDFDSPVVGSGAPPVVIGASTEAVGIGVSEKLIQRLLKDGKYALIDRSAVENLLKQVKDKDRNELGAYGLAARIGRQLGLDALIIGAVTRYGPDNKLEGKDSRRSHPGIHIRKSKAFVEITARVFDVSSGEIIAEFRGEGESARSGDVLIIRSKANANTPQEVLGSEFVDSLLNEATANAVDQIAENLNLFAGKIPARRFTKGGPMPTGEELMSFCWPDGKKAAVSLSFDDARPSQVDNGLALFKKKGVKVTFFVQPSRLEERLAGWTQAVTDGHEIGNHSLTHPCTGNYSFSRQNALEDYDLSKMARQLDGANQEIYRLLGVRPQTFAYPCGQKFVGKGMEVKSYVPLVAERFLVGRGYLDESANDPLVCDLAQAMGTGFDEMDFTQMKRIVDEAVQEGRWVIFLGHDIGERGYQTTDTMALEALCDYLSDPGTGVWLGTVEEIAGYIRKQKENSNASAGKQ